MSDGAWVYSNRRIGWAMVAVAAVLLAGGYGAVRWRTELAAEQVRDQLTDQASDLARTINPERVRALTFTAADSKKPEYLRLCNQMAAYQAGMHARGVWSAGLRDGQLRFGPTSFPQAGPRAIAPGTIYKQSSAQVDRLLAGGPAFIPGPQSDAPGNSVSAIAPVRDPRSGKLLMVVGLEMEADLWNKAISQARRIPILSVLILAAILFLGAGIVIWRNRLAPDRASHWRSVEVYTLAALGLTLTLMGTWASDDHQRRLRNRQFRQLAQANFDLVLNAFQGIPTQILDALELFFQSSQEVSRDEFHHFTTPMVQSPAIQGVAFSPLVPDPHQVEWEARARTEGLADFTVWQESPDGGRQPVSGRPIYYPIWFLEPQLENAAVMGFDLGSEAACGEAIETALESGLPTISDPLRLVGQKAGSKGLIVFQPFYAGDGHRQLLGLGLVAINLKALLQMALSGGLMEKPPTMVALYQNFSGQGPGFIEDSTTQSDFASKAAPGVWLSSDSGHGSLCLSFPLFAHGQTYTLLIHPSPEFLATLPAGAWWVPLTVGLLLTTALTTLTHLALRRRAILETQVQERTAQLQATLYSIGDAVVTTDVHGHVRQMNRVAVDLTGWPEAEAQGKPLEEVLRISEHGNPPEMDLLASVLGGRKPERFSDSHAWLMGRHGGRRPIDYSGAAIRDARGEFRGVVVVLRDITERKEAEAALHQQNDLLRRITDTSPVGIVVANLQGHITFANGTTESIMGLSREQLIQRSHNASDWEVFDIAGNPIKTEDMPFPRVLAAQGPIYDAEYALNRPDGRRVLLSINGAPLRDAAGQITGAVFSLTDITAQKQLQESFLQAQKMESVGRLAGGVAHDFNNMLSVINGYCEILLARLGGDDPIRADIQEILGAGRRSELLVRQLLAFARKQTIAPVRMDLNKTVTATLKMLSRIIGEDIRLVWAPTLDIWPVRMDPAQVDQILSNLVVNARDAISGGGKVTIETGMASFDKAYCEAHAGFLPGDYVLLAVSDNGCGMDRQTRMHVFEPFFTTKPQGQGTGLGLATVYGIVSQNNGFINVYSEAGLGTTIKIYLPRFDEELTAAPQIEGSSNQMPGGTETILLVEDEEALLKLTELQLGKLGYTVLMAGTPEQAIDQVQAYEGSIHLLMTDVIMPEMSGRDLWQRIEALRPGLKCLFMSGYTADIITHHGVLDQGVHFLQKPFQMQALAVKLREALET